MIAGMSTSSQSSRSCPPLNSIRFTPKMGEDDQATEFGFEIDREAFLRQLRKETPEKRWRATCADILAASLLHKSIKESSLWNYWDLEVRKSKGSQNDLPGLNTLHARCKSNPQTHTVKPVELNKASTQGVSN